MNNQRLIRNHKFPKREATQRSDYMEEARNTIYKHQKANTSHVTFEIHKSCFKQLKKEFPNLLITRDHFLDHLCSSRNYIMISVTFPEN